LVRSVSGLRLPLRHHRRQVVDGADLATMLADWGDAPRYDIPPSDCPLNLINP